MGTAWQPASEESRGLWLSPTTPTFGERPVVGGPLASGEWQLLLGGKHYSGHTAALCMGPGGLEVLGHHLPLPGTCTSLPARPLE